MLRNNAARFVDGKIAMSASVAVIALVIPACANAQDVSSPAPATAVQSPADSLGDIVVTARRESESLQNVPVSVQVVTGDAIQKLAIVQPSEIAKLAPGLSIRLAEPGNPSLVLRGVRWVQASGTPAIPIYFNEIGFDPVQSLQTMYDVGQVEVLRGPQGTSRGAPSISGAVTITTRLPDLQEMGGYASGLIGTHDHQNVQGAINFPIVPGVFAVRVAGSYDNSQGNRVRSIYAATDPSLKTWSGRVSARFEPTDTLSINAMYQRLNQSSDFYTQVAGAGSSGLYASPYPTTLRFAPAGYNIDGRSAIRPGERLSVQETPNKQYLKTDLVTVNARWEVLGQVLSYNYGIQSNNRPKSFGTSVDQANVLIGYDQIQEGFFTDRAYKNFHELRLSSDRAAGRFFDYDIGFYREQARSSQHTLIPNVLPGARGNPFGLPNPVVNPAAIDRYFLTADTNIQLRTKTYSFYGNLQLHLPSDFELSAGVRRIHDSRPSSIDVATSSGYAAAGLASSFGGTCPTAAGLVASPVYAGVCDAFVPAGTRPTQSLGKVYTPTIYNVSLSRKFGPDVLVYATVGSSWRSGLPALANALPDDLLFPTPEKATSYELGVKTSLGRRARFNAAVFQIDYKGQLTQFQGISYFRTDTSRVDTTNVAFLYNVDARVRGAEAQLTVKPLHDLTLDFNLSYAKIESQGGQVPCNVGPAVSASNPMNFCNSAKGSSLNAASPFTASVNGDYTIPMGNFDGYLRFVGSYQGRNPAFGISDPDFKAKRNMIVDLFAGLTGSGAGWDVGVFAKNVFNTKRLLTSTTLQNTIAPEFGATGLSAVTVTPGREIGLQLRYAFGSR